MGEATGNGEYVVLLYYKYVRLCDSAEEVEEIVKQQIALCESLSLNGRVRLAMEGINGTLGGSAEHIEQYVATMSSMPQFQGIDWKTSTAPVKPFPELLVRAVKEIVAMEVPDEQCSLANGGEHLTPERFHQEQQNCSPDDYALIDVRNAYEYNIGHFEGALNPNTRRFGQFPEWVQAELPTLKQKKKVLMYCTGGIRCEKASAYLKHLGLENVYQLSGGIHRYLEAFPDGGRFRGKNFVFDQRVSMASQDETVEGRCENCQEPHDVISGETRCEYCRVHVLLCKKCTHDLVHIFCPQHATLVQGTAEELEQRAEQLRHVMSLESGRSRKGRRRSLRKQLDTVTQRIQELSTNSPH
ncbi:TPA: hypothetical protein N0F65_005370 [Lagenidium giganteum]|uniref:Rhodanese domain-containing protein n=1 Tax=Lagenidium giganteum TaxID=4803 RepID=A0AAV2YJ45_9STRA|nr:TPA: hypothetical protein N0F65_005370 [Lagenidium giganteum]